MAEPGAPVVSAEEPIDRDRASVAFYPIDRRHCWGTHLSTQHNAHHLVGEGVSY
jgi:hypothetical protein|uniref:Uncharacterized protein n=1 Tax=Picea glauca TaxID=3330 RepID=A0A101M4U7_PICGL|nr:hypothetical protein ABT39_MTgene844 [Picea glauca]